MPLKNGTKQHPLTVEEARKGGKKSGQVRREKKMLAEQMKVLLEMPIPQGKTRTYAKSMGYKESELTNDKLILLGLLKGCAEGNVSAIQELRKMIGDENVSAYDNETIEDDELTKALKAEARRMKKCRD